MISNPQPTLVVTCKLSTAYRLAVAETVLDRARIVYLDELKQPAARRAALSSATVLLAHNPIKDLRADEISGGQPAAIAGVVVGGPDEEVPRPVVLADPAE